MPGTTEQLFGVTETEQVNPEPEKEAIDEVTQKETKQVNPNEDKSNGSQEKEQEKITYTPEELAKAIANDEEIDTSRLSLEGQALMKSFQRGLTPKLQEIAELRKQMKSTLEKKQEPARPKNIEDFFNEDPEGTLGWIDQQIAIKLTEADKFEDDGDERSARKAHREALQWESTKSTLTIRKTILFEKENKKEKQLQKTLEAYPEYGNKKTAIVEFLTHEADFTEDEANDIVDATKGMSNVKVAKLIAKFVDQKTAIETAKGKIVKKAPDALGRPGSSTIQTSKATDFDYQAEFEKAKKTGDWTAVLKHKGAI